jgi:hypothetical protein
MAESSQTTPAPTAITVTTELARRETTFREAMEAARSAVEGLVSRALARRRRTRDIPPVRPRRNV